MDATSRHSFRKKPAASGADWWLILGSVALMLLGGACRATAAASTPAAPASSPATSAVAGSPSGTITVFAAASLTDAFNQIARDFEKAHPGTHVVVSYGASSQLAIQITQGAPADVFASADEAQMAVVQRAGLLDGSPSTFVHNRVVIITPADDPAHVQSLKDLARPGIKVVSTAPQVPIGAYTRDLLAKASKDPSYGSSFGADVQRNIVSQENDVRGVVTKVQLGDADAGIVYASDVTPSVRNRVREIEIPASLNPPVSYPIAVLRGRSSTGGRAFVAQVLSPAGQAVLRTWGFVPATAATP